MPRDGGTLSEVAPAGGVPHHSGNGARDLAERAPLPRRRPRQDATEGPDWAENTKAGKNVIVAGTPRMQRTPTAGDDTKPGKDDATEAALRKPPKVPDPVYVEGKRVCLRCLLGASKGAGGKHYSHDRGAPVCVLYQSEARGGAARKLLQEAARAPEAPQVGILVGHTLQSKLRKPKEAHSQKRQRTARPTTRDAPTTTRRTRTTTRTGGTGTPSRATKASRQTKTTRPTAGDSSTTTRRTRTSTKTPTKATPKSETREQSRSLRGTKHEHHLGENDETAFLPFLCLFEYQPENQAEINGIVLYNTGHAATQADG